MCGITYIIEHKVFGQKIIHCGYHIMMNDYHFISSKIMVDLRYPKSPLLIPIGYGVHPFIQISFGVVYFLDYMFKYIVYSIVENTRIWFYSLKSYHFKSWWNLGIRFQIYPT